MDLRISGQIIRNVNLEVLYDVYSSTANEAEVECLFDEYLKDIGYGSVGRYFTKRAQKIQLINFHLKQVLVMAIQIMFFMKMKQVIGLLQWVM